MLRNYSKTVHSPSDLKKLSDFNQIWINSTTFQLRESKVPTGLKLYFPVMVNFRKNEHSNNIILIIFLVS